MIGILIVDDNVQLREAVRMELEAHEHVFIVGEAGDGVTAVQLAHSLRPEVVLMDVNMARLDGVAATRRIRTLLPDTVLVGMSCHTREMVETAMLSAGADVFLPKDIVGQQLLPAVSQVLTRRAPNAHESTP
jgi:DNA-binding NarL/FixJ family response regulator